MKKIIFMFAGLCVLAACQQQPAPESAEQKPAEEAAASVDEKWLTFEMVPAEEAAGEPTEYGLVALQEEPCDIKGYDCREVISKLPLTTEEPASEELAKEAYWNIPGGTKYVNPALDQMGMKITYYLMYRDGTTQYVLDDMVGIHIKSSLGETPDAGKITVKFKDGPSFAFNPVAEPEQPSEAAPVAAEPAPEAAPAAQEAPAATEEVPAAAQTDAACSYKGHNCWEIVALLGNTKEIRTPKENPTPEDLWTPDIITYENPALKELGMQVTFYTMYRDGGSTRYIIDDNMSVYTNNSIGADASQRGTKTIKFKDGRKFIYDPDGTLRP